MARSKKVPEADNNKSDLTDEAEVVSPEPVESGVAPDGEDALPETDIKAEDEADAEAAGDESPPEAEIETEVADSVAIEEPPTEPVPHPEPRKRSGGGFLATVTGGILAAVIGFGAARYVVPEGWPFPGTGGGEDALAASLADQGKQITGLEDELKRLQTAMAELPKAETGNVTAELSALETRIDSEMQALSGQLTDLSGKISSIEARLTEVEARPAAAGGGDNSAAIQEYEKELAAMRAELATQRAENEKMAGNIASVADDAQSKIDAAAARAQQLEQRTALLRLQTALETGDAFQGALAGLGGDVPAALTQNAATGVPTLAMLQDSFAPAAREALSASLRSEAGGSTTERVSAFLRSQLNARSLEPREGSDPDAILSRAESDVRSGQLDAALTEIAALPQPGQAVMAEWAAMAIKRVEVLAAADSLMNSLNQN